MALHFLCGILFAILALASAEWCIDDLGVTQYCAYGCCGLTDDYCCDATGWAAGSIAGLVVGLVFFFIFLTLIVICCRRRRYGTVYNRYGQGGTGVTVVASSSQQQVGSVSAGVASYPQYPPQQYGQQAYGQAAYPPAYAPQPPSYTQK